MYKRQIIKKLPSPRRRDERQFPAVPPKLAQMHSLCSVTWKHVGH